VNRASVVPARADSVLVAAAGTDFDLDGATIPELQARMASGPLTAVGLTLAYLYRIHTVGQHVNAVLAINPRAIEEAAASDLRRRTGAARGSLEGIPVLLKDNINSLGQPATAGSRALLNAGSGADAALVRRLKDVGAVVLGKANLSEWANFRSKGSTGGWSAVGGLTRNPYLLGHSAGGSSAGSAAGVAASLAQVAIGTETNGSIICPGGQNGVVAIKPTRGLISRTGVVPVSLRQDVPGPIARHVVDAALTLAALQGADADDPATLRIPAGQPDSYVADLGEGGLRGKRIGVWRLVDDATEVGAVLSHAVEALRGAGAETVEVTLSYQDESAEAAALALLSEFKHDINGYLSMLAGSHPVDLGGLIRFNLADPVELRYFGQELFEQAEAAPPVTDRRVRSARATALRLQRRAVDEILSGHRLDAIMAPTNAPAWPIRLGHGDEPVLDSASPAGVSGYPSITVPAGYAGPLPVGVSFFGARWNETHLIRIAYAFECLTRVRRAPTFLLSTPR
jgi:amidase